MKSLMFTALMCSLVACTDVIVSPQQPITLSLPEGCVLEGSSIVCNEQTIPYDPADWRAVYEAVAPSIGKAFIYQIDNDGRRTYVGHGTAWVIAPGIVATNWHVADGLFGVSSYFPDVRRYDLCVSFLVAGVTGEFILPGEESCATDFSTSLYWYDLAYVKLPTGNRVPLRVNPNVQALDPVMAMGFPSQYSVTSTVGVVSSIEHQYGITTLQSTASIDGGNSGGPLLNQAGEVVGVNSSVFFGSYDIHYQAVWGGHFLEKEPTAAYYMAVPRLETYTAATDSRLVSSETVGSEYSVELSMTAGNVYVIETSPPLAGADIGNTTIEVWDTDYDYIIALDYSSGVGEHAKVVYLASTDIDAEVVVYSPCCTGSYELTIQEWSP